MDATIDRTALDRIRAWLPRGDTLDDEAFRERHRTLSILLALHVPVLAAFGIYRGYGVAHSVLEAGIAGVFLGLALIPQMHRRMKGILVSAGLVWCSAIAVHFSGGVIEAHFHFFVILGFIALYQDWAAFGWAIVFTALSHGVGSQLGPELMYNHEAAIQRPWTWALIHAAMVLFAAVGQVIGWRHAELAQNRATELNTQLVREQAERQTSYGRIYVNLARRTQSLLHRQLSVIDELEEQEEDPETLQKLFALDHLATRVRRNSESLLVMAGQNSPRRWDSAVSLAEVARAAASEIEQYDRVDVRVDEGIELAGTAVVDITHLLAELIENAAEYSSPTTSVLVEGTTTPRGAVINVIDRGIGLSPEDLRSANATLTDPPELDDEVIRHLGFQVVGRLARKLAIRVHLEPTPEGGTTAVLELPPALLANDAPADAQGREPEPASASATVLPFARPDAPAAPRTAEQPPADPPSAPAPQPQIATTGHEHHRDAPSTPAASTGSASTAPGGQPDAARPAPAAPDSGARTPASDPSPPALFSAAQPPTSTFPQAGGNGHRTVPGNQAGNGHAPVPGSQAGNGNLPASGNGHRAPTNGALPPVPDLGGGSVRGGTTADTPGDDGIDPLFDHFFDGPSTTASLGQAASQSEPVTPSPGHAPPPPGSAAPPPGPTTAGPGQAVNPGQDRAAADTPDRTPSGLPRRTPAANLAEQLRKALDDPDPTPGVPPAPPEARQALSAFQAGGRAGRRATDDGAEEERP